MTSNPIQVWSLLLENLARLISRKVISNGCCAGPVRLKLLLEGGGWKAGERRLTAESDIFKGLTISFPKVVFVFCSWEGLIVQYRGTILLIEKMESKSAVF